MRRAHRPRVQPGPVARPRESYPPESPFLSASERRAIRVRQMSFLPREELTPEGRRAVS